MNHEEMLLVMTVCEALGQPKSPEEIEKAHDKAVARLEKFLNPQRPRDAKITYAGRE